MRAHTPTTKFRPAVMAVPIFFSERYTSDYNIAVRTGIHEDQGLPGGIQTTAGIRRRVRLSGVSCVMTLAGVVAVAQPLFTADDLDDAMKGVGRQFELVSRTIAASDFEGAKVRVTRAREQLSPTISFWRNHRRDDAVEMVRAATRSLDDLDTALSEPTIDADAVTAAAGAVQAACDTCHAVYREPEPGTEAFRLKRGAVE